MSRNNEIKILFIIMFITNLLGTLAAFYINRLSGVIMFFMVSMVFTYVYYFTKWRYSEIKKLSVYLSRIYNGKYHLDVRDNRDGELSILKNDIYNLTETISHSDRGTQYTSEAFRQALAAMGIIQSMNSAAGRCHDNAKCESMWARGKEEVMV